MRVPGNTGALMWNRRLVSLLAASLSSLGLTACHNDNSDPPPALDPGVPVVTHSIGGTVTGSSGSLTLQNSANSSTQVVASAGAFTFATQVAAGASYNVTTAIPPNGQTCTVTNGTGTMGTADVTNINVSCSTNPLSLGGTVSGLAAGATLVLRALSDGTSGDRTITANGAFTFSINFLPNAEYLVLVLTQPLNQTCTIVNGEGSFATANISNVAVTCVNNSASSRNWQPAVNLATDPDVADANGFRTPRVAYDSAGNALAVWVADTQGAAGTHLMWSRRPSGGAWTAPAQIPDWAPPPPDPALGVSNRDPVLAVAPNGNAVAAWGVLSINGNHVMASTYTPASGWTTPVFIWRKHPDMPSGALDLRIAADSAGNTLVTFAASGSIYYNRHTPGSGWVDAAAVEGFGRTVSTLIGPATEPEMALNAAGQAVAIWRQGIAIPMNLPSDFDLWSSRYDMATDTWTAPQQLEDGPGVRFYGKSLVIDTAGTATALWSDVENDRLHIRASRLVGDTWAAPSIVESGNTSDTGFATDPHAVIDGNGNIMAVWQQGDIDEANFVASRYVPGTVWGGQQVIGAYVGSASVIFDTELTLAGNAAGHVVAVWTLPGCVMAENVPCPTDLNANEYNPANGNWGAEEVIDKEAIVSSEIDGNASTPQVAVDVAGNAVAVWDQDGAMSSDGIRAAVFE
jgi:hypothetical protein